MPENENIIPEAEVVETVEQVVIRITSNEEEEDVKIVSRRTLLHYRKIRKLLKTNIQVELNEDVAMEYLAESKE
jgi:hypothetical protein